MGTFECSDCVTWVNSEYAKSDGTKYCEYSKRYEKPNQKIYGCRGFVWARVILTKFCEILNIDSSELFNAFDDARDNYVKPNEPELLQSYYDIAPYIIKGLDTLPNKEELAKSMINSYVIDAEANVKMGNYCEAVKIYSEMVRVLHIMIDVVNNYDIHHNLVKIK